MTTDPETERRVEALERQADALERLADHQAIQTGALLIVAEQFAPGRYTVDALRDEAAFYAGGDP